MALVLRDMCNEVVRVERADLLDEAAVCAMAQCLPVVFPLSPEIADCVVVALATLGVRGAPDFSEGRCRAVCDDVTEILVW